VIEPGRRETRGGFGTYFLSGLLVMKPSFRLLATTLLCAATLASSIFAQEKTPGELVVNSGFEDATLGAPANWSGVPFITTASSASQKGKYALKIESPDAEYAPLAGQDIFDFVAGKPYRLQYDVRADRFGVEYRAYLGLWKNAAKDAPAGTPATEWIDGVDTDWRQGAEAWHHVIVDFTPTDKANRIMVVLQMKGPGAVWFDNVSITPHNPGDEEIAAPEIVAPVAEAPKNEAVAAGDRGVKITADRRFIVDGKPFFPIQIWGWTPYTDEAMKTAHDWGFNVVSTPALREYGPQATRAWMDAAQRNNVRAMIAMAFNLPPATAKEWSAIFIKQLEPLMPILRNHPELFGYNINDEPAWAGYDVAAHNAAAQWIKKQDATHPIFVNHAPRNTIAELKKYNPFIDISGSDIYPVWNDGIDKHSDLPNKTLSVVGDETRKNLEAVDYKKPVMQTLQGFSWSAKTNAPDLHPFPTRAQSRFMAWDSIVAGATGIAWFQDERYKELRPELKPIVHEFASLQDVLAGGEMLKTEGVFASPIQSMAWKWNGKTVLVAINPADKGVALAPNWNRVFGSTPALRVLWENRNSAAREKFAPFDVHLYTDAQSDAEILRSGYDVPPIAP
jgi:hypothetical protein